MSGGHAIMNLARNCTYHQSSKTVRSKCPAFPCLDILLLNLPGNDPDDGTQIRHAERNKSLFEKKKIIDLYVYGTRAYMTYIHTYMTYFEYASWYWHILLFRSCSSYLLTSCSFPLVQERGNAYDTCPAMRQWGPVRNPVTVQICRGNNGRIGVVPPILSGS